MCICVCVVPMRASIKIEPHAISPKFDIFVFFALYSMVLLFLFRCHSFCCSFSYDKIILTSYLVLSSIKWKYLEKPVCLNLDVLAHRDWRNVRRSISCSPTIEEEEEATKNCMKINGIQSAFTQKTTKELKAHKA